MTRPVVVGAGIAGLSAAKRLVELGLDPVVLEASPDVGGRMRSVQGSSGRWYDQGAEIISDRDEGFLRYADELDLRRHLLPYGPGDGVPFTIEREGVLHDVDMMDPGSIARFGAISWKGKARMVRVLGDALRARRMAGGGGAEHEAWRSAALDDRSVADWLGPVSEEFLEYLVEPTYNLLCGWVPEELSRAYVLHVLANFPRVQTFTFTEGVGMLARRLAATVDVRTGCPVAGIDVRTGEVRYVDGDHEQRLVANGLVVAVPGHLASRIIDGLDDERMELLKGVRYVAHSHAFFEIDGDLGEEIPYRLFPRREDENLAAAGVIAAPTDASHLVFRAGLKAARDREIAEQPDEVMFDRLRAFLDQRWPGLAARLRDPVACRWREGLPAFQTGHLRAMARFWSLPPVPGLAFAGDWSMSSSTGGAHVSGVRAADHVAATAH